MPNWTYNTIRISGEKEQLTKMLTDAVKNENGKLQLSSWFPVPETYRKYDTTNHPNGERLVIGQRVGWEEDSPIVTAELIEEFKRATAEQRMRYGAVGWYDYNCKYFGCKWDMELDSIEQTEDEIHISVQTPWSDPDAWLIRLSKRYPELTFSNYADFEEGDWYDYTIKGGKEICIEHGVCECNEEEED